MAGKIKGGVGLDQQPLPPKQQKPMQGRFAGQRVTPVADQPYMNQNKGAAVKGKTKTALFQRNPLSNEIPNLQPAAPITFKGATIDQQYNYPIVPAKDLLKVKKLGEGAFGTVDLVIHRHTNQRLALKMVGDDTERRKECAQLIKIQRAVARTGGNPNHIVNLISLSRGRSNQKYALLEYGGMNLYQSLKKDGCFNGSELKSTFHQAIKGVNTLFEAGYQHHDIKPENILIDGKGIVKICDFGIAEPLRRKTQNPNGTSWYMPLEKLYELNTLDNDRADSWSLGCTFAEMSLGHPVIPVSDDMVKGGIPLEKAVDKIKKMKKKAYKQLLQKEGKEAAELFLSLTELNPANRLSPTEALSHSYFRASVNN